MFELTRTRFKESVEEHSQQIRDTQSDFYAALTFRILAEMEWERRRLNHDYVPVQLGVIKNLVLESYRETEEE